MGISFLNFTLIFFIILIYFLLKDSFEPLINYINNGFEFYSKYEIFLNELLKEPIRRVLENCAIKISNN
jgi:hypothetical protein